MNMNINIRNYEEFVLLVDINIDEIDLARELASILECSVNDVMASNSSNYMNIYYLVEDIRKNGDLIRSQDEHNLYIFNDIKVVLSDFEGATGVSLSQSDLLNFRYPKSESC